MPVQQTFIASRNATWAPPLAYIYDGTGGPLALTGAHIAMQVRLYEGAADPALLVLNPIAVTSDLDNGDGTRTLTLNLGAGFTPTQLAALPGLAAAQMAELAVLAALPAPEPPDVDANQCFAFDIRITYADATSEVLSSGSFIVSPGVTTV